MTHDQPACGSADARLLDKLLQDQIRSPSPSALRPEAQELATLHNSLIQAGLLQPDPGDVRRSWIEDTDPDRRLVAYRFMLQHCGRAAADRSLAQLQALFGTGAVIELAAMNPGSGGRETCVGVIDADRDKLGDFIALHWGCKNLYVGRDPRRAADQRTVGNAEDVAASRFVAFDFDLKPQEAADAWSLREQELVSKLGQLGPAMTVRTGLGGLHVWLELVGSRDLAEQHGRARQFNQLSKLIGSDSVSDLPRILRAPWTINIPTTDKRQRGRKIALAVAVPHPVSRRVWAPDALQSAVQEAFGVDSAAVSSQAASPASRPTPDRSPTLALACDMLRALPNTSPGPFDDRADWVTVMHAFSGATGHSPDVRDVFLDWTARNGGDPQAAEHAWDSLDPRNVHSGHRNLRALVRQHCPADLADSLRWEEQRLTFDTPPQGIKDAAQAALAASKGAKAGAGTPGDAALALLQLHQAELWIDDRSDAYVTLTDKNGIVSHHSLQDRAGQLAVQGYCSSFGVRVSGDQQIKRLCDDLTADARARMVKHTPHVRFAVHQDAFYLDLGDRDSEVLEITAAGQRTVTMADCPARFVRPDGLKPLPAPQTGQSSFFDLICRHVALPDVQDYQADDAGIQARAAVLTFLCGALDARDGPTRPLLLLDGPAGSGKTTTASRIGDLLDPHSLEVIVMPQKPRDVCVLARNVGILRLDSNPLSPPNSREGLQPGLASRGERGHHPTTVEP